jgi:alanine dehydrogenase
MDTLIIQRADIRRLLTIDECMNAVERAFRLQGEGKLQPPKILGFPAKDGAFHIKAALFESGREYFVAKINANFPSNTKKFALPTIQGVIALYDATNGRLLALMDSIEITILRTGAATGLAAKYLSLPDSTVMTICGCGNQGRISLKVLMKVRGIKRCFAYDADASQTKKFVLEFNSILETIPITSEELSVAISQSQVVVTCTPSAKPYIGSTDISAGTFIAAVGADSEGKHELFPELVASGKIVVDLLEQAATIGDLHYALEKKLISVDHVHAELGNIIAGKKPGRESTAEVIIFDSTGLAIQDAAAAVVVFENGLAAGLGKEFNFQN